MAAFAQFGSDLDVATQRLLARGERLTEQLQQPQFSPLQVEEQVVVIYAGTKGYLDKIPTASVGRFEAEFLRHMRGDGKALLETIRDEKALSDASEKKLVETLDSFAAGFAA